MKYANATSKNNLTAASEQPLTYLAKSKMKRLTIDVTMDLHRAIKVSCARKGVKMADAIRYILEKEFGKSE